MSFRMLEKWIWLDDEKYPDCQNTVYSGFLQNDDTPYTVAEFFKEYNFDKKIKSINIRFSGDTTFQLYLNGEFIAIGPTPVAGDFIGNEQPRGQHYSNEIELFPDSDKLEFFARVKLSPVGMGEYSHGRGGFMLSGFITFDDMTETVIFTDNTWLARKNNAYVRPYLYDNSQIPDEYTFAKVIQNIWKTETAPLKNRTEEIISPKNNVINILPHEEKEVILELDKIYAGFFLIEVKTKSRLEVSVSAFETVPKEESKERFAFIHDDVYRGFQMHSIGGYIVKIKNKGNSEAVIRINAIACCYPVLRCAKTVTSDIELNELLEVCTHTLKYCRQHIHLDSPRHCEPLACTGDYYIESLMTAFSFGDFDLAKFDILRTAELLRNNNGRMFHTTYSLIWVQMLYDVYFYTDDIKLIEECKDALILLLNLFETYIGENGLIETPPDYMFVDWLYIDGISMHHPPKALGQTCLNMFYFGALKTAAKIYDILGLFKMASMCLEKSENVKNAINTYLFDEKRGLYFEGLNTPTPEKLLGPYMPQNVEKRYYLVHSNILAAYFGVCDKEKCRMLIDKIMNDKSLGDCQPYFKHFLLEAVYRNDLREKYTLKIINEWKPFVKECNKGLAEGFLPPEPSYPFDHSHAWGGTPLYSLPKALSGMEIVKPGYKEVKFNPSLLGLECAEIEIPTPKGIIRLKLEEGKETLITNEF